MFFFYDQPFVTKIGFVAYKHDHHVIPSFCPYVIDPFCSVEKWCSICDVVHNLFFLFIHLHICTHTQIFILLLPPFSIKQHFSVQVEQKIKNRSSPRFKTPRDNNKNKPRIENCTIPIARRTSQRHIYNYIYIYRIHRYCICIHNVYSLYSI